MVDKNVEDFIQHHGVRGMKWGVRRTRSSVSPGSSDHRKAAALKSKKLHELTNKQLKDLNERRRLEQEHIRLNPSSSPTKKAVNTVKTGHAAVKTILGVIGTAGTIYALSSTPHGKAAIAASKKFMNEHKELLARKAAQGAQLTLF